MAGTKGNTNSSKTNRLWGDTIRRAAAQSDGKRLRKIAEKLFDMAEAGDIAAIKELGDRLDGKSTQQIVGAGEEGEHLFQAIERRIVMPKSE